MKILKKLFKLILTILIAVLLIKGALVVFDGYAIYKDTLNEKSLENRVYEVTSRSDFTGLDSVSEYFLDALVSVEDKDYYKHGAINIKSLARAVVKDIMEGEFKEGGSTITQQTAKNLCLYSDKKLSRKVAELFIAYDLEKTYTKDEILAVYINIIYFGDGFNGIDAASKGYFGKNPIDLTLDEATLLAGLPQAPSVYALSTNMDKAKERREEVVEAMVSNNALSEEEAEALLN